MRRWLDAHMLWLTTPAIKANKPNCFYSPWKKGREMPDVELKIQIKGLDLDEKMVRRLNAEVQSLTMRELANLDLASEELRIKIGSGFPLGIVVQRP